MEKKAFVRVDTKTHRKAKIASAITEKTIQEIMCEAFEEWLKKHKVNIEKEVQYGSKVQSC